MQNYKEIALTDYAKDAVMQLADNVKSVVSNFSGTAFPTEDLYDGMLCYRTDEKKYYTYVATSATWEWIHAKAMTYKGSVDKYSDLPTEAEVGDVYNVKEADKTHGVKAGDNVIWSGTDWDNMGGSVDLTAYALTADQAKDVVSASNTDAKITLNHRDGTATDVTINNVAHATSSDTATKATQDADGNVISNTYAKSENLATVATSGAYSDLSGVPTNHATYNTATVGGTENPVYLNNGVITACDIMTAEELRAILDE